MICHEESLCNARLMYRFVNMYIVIYICVCIWYRNTLTSIKSRKSTIWPINGRTLQIRTWISSILYIYIHWWQPILWWTIYCALGHIHSSEYCTKRRRSDTADTAVYRCLTWQLQNKRCRKVNPTKIEVPSGKQTWQWKTPCFFDEFPSYEAPFKKGLAGEVTSSHVPSLCRCHRSIGPHLETRWGPELGDGHVTSSTDLWRFFIDQSGELDWAEHAEPTKSIQILEILRM